MLYKLYYKSIFQGLLLQSINDNMLKMGLNTFNNIIWKKVISISNKNSFTSGYVPVGQSKRRLWWSIHWNASLGSGPCMQPRMHTLVRLVSKALKYLNHKRIDVWNNLVCYQTHYVCTG
jgi:hypothetical protein